MSQPSTRPPVSPLLAILFAILAVSTASIFIRFAQGYAPSIVIAAFRLSVASLVLAPVTLARHRPDLRRLTRGELVFAFFSGVFLALHFATWISSLAYTTVASSVVLASTAPLWVAILAPLVIKEPLTRLVLVGIGLTLVGSSLVGLSDTCTLSNAAISCPPLATFIHGKAFFGDLLALTGGIMAALYLLMGRKLRGGMSLMSYIFVVYSVAAVILIGIMLVAGETPWGYPPQAYLWLLLLALVPQLLGHSTFNWALRYLSAAYVSITLLGEPIGSTILAYFLFKEAPTPLKILGGVLILSGIYIASRSEAAPAPMEAAVIETQ